MEYDFDGVIDRRATGRTRRHYERSFERRHLVTSRGIIPTLYEPVGYICKPDEKVLIVTPSCAYFRRG